MTPGALSQIVPAYQTTKSASSTLSTGSARAHAAARALGIVIAMSGLEAGAHSMGDCGELRGFPDVKRALGRQVAVDHVDDAAGPRAHHHDARRQKHGFGDRVRDEDHRLAGALPPSYQLLVQMVADDLVNP